MNREERRRSEREQRRGTGERPLYRDGRWVASAGHLTEVRAVAPGRDEAEVQDFLAGTAFAYGAALLDPSGPGPDVPPLFTVLVHDDDSTYGPCPQLPELFKRLDRVGPAALSDELVVASSWSVLARTSGTALIKLNLDFHQPVRSSARIVLMAENYAQMWQYVAAGGLVGITTMQRLQRAQSRPNTTYADAIKECIPIGVASSPGIQQLIQMFNWPADHLKP